MSSSDAGAAAEEVFEKTMITRLRGDDLSAFLDSLNHGHCRALDHEDLKGLQTVIQLGSPFPCFGGRVPLPELILRRDHARKVLDIIKARTPMSESDLIVVRRLEDPGYYDNVRVGDPIFEQVQRWLDNARRSARSQQLGQPPKIYSEDEVTSFKWAEEICLNICAGDAIRLIYWMEAVPPCRVEARAKDEVHGL